MPLIATAHTNRSRNRRVDWTAAKLKSGEVDVWRIDLNLVEPRQECLSEEERERAVRFVSPELRKAFVSAHVGLRRILASYLGCKPESLGISAMVDGKPFLPDYPGFHFNLSHSGTIALVAVAWAPVGVDVEQVERKVDYTVLAERFFHERERQAMLSGADSRKAFFDIWTAKEACLKATGVGLRAELSAIDVSGVLGERECAVQVANNAGVAVPVYARSLDFHDASGCVASTKPVRVVLIRSGTQ